MWLTMAKRWNAEQTVRDLKCGSFDTTLKKTNLPKILRLKIIDVGLRVNSN